MTLSALAREQGPPIAFTIEQIGLELLSCKRLDCHPHCIAIVASQHDCSSIYCLLAIHGLAEDLVMA
eukprot:9406757-Lingulodinium_polyedra.AAC.1